MAVFVLTAVTGILTARLLGVSDRGVVATVSVFAAMVGQAANAGPAEAQLLARARGLSVGPTTVVTWSVSAVLTAAVALGSAAYAAHIAPGDTAIVAMALMLPVAAAVGQMSNYLLLGDRRYGTLAALRVVPPSAQVALLLVIAIFVAATTHNVLATSLVAGALTCVLTVRLSRPWSRRSRWVTADARKALRFVLTSGGTHALRILGYRLDLVLVGLLIGTYAAGIYSVAIALAAAATSLIGNLTPLLMTKPDGESREYSQLSSLVCWCLATAIAVLGPVLIPIVYGPDYRPGWTLMSALALCVIGAFSADTGFRLLQKSGHEIAALALAITMIVLQATFIALGSSQFGLTGAAAGNALAYGCGIAISLVAASRWSIARTVASQLSPLRGARVLRRRLAAPPSDASSSAAD